MESLEMVCLDKLEAALLELRKTKELLPDRSETTRRYAVTITELEKVIGYFETWVVREAEK